MSLGNFAVRTSVIWWAEWGALCRLKLVAGILSVRGLSLLFVDVESRGASNKEAFFGKTTEEFLYAKRPLASSLELDPFIMLVCVVDGAVSQFSSRCVLLSKCLGKMKLQQQVLRHEWALDYLVSLQWSLPKASWSTIKWMSSTFGSLVAMWRIDETMLRAMLSMMQ